jgi:hypothetical protein
MGFWERLVGRQSKRAPPRPLLHPEIRHPRRIEQRSSTQQGLYYWVQTDLVSGGGDDPKASVETRVYTVLVSESVPFEEACSQSLSFREDREWDKHLLIQNRSEGYQIGRYVTNYPDGTLREVDVKYSKVFA